MQESEMITLLRAERDHWMKVAETDELTGIINRRGFIRRTDDADGWYLFCDLNGFKQAQDAHPDGHAYGDAILREFKEFCESITRGGSEDQVLARLGGDEFAIWCPTLIGARRINKVVQRWRSGDGKVGCAVGLGKTLQAADAAMYLNKQEQ